QFDLLAQGGRREDLLWRQGRPGRRECAGLALALLQLTLDSVLMLSLIRAGRDALAASILACAAVTGLLSAPAHAERIKDIATVNGVRSNQLVGYGLVVGLDGTGDQTSQAPFTIQSITNMLAKFGITIPANANPQLKNVAAVT